MTSHPMRYLDDEDKTLGEMIKETLLSCETRAEEITFYRFMLVVFEDVHEDLVKEGKGFEEPYTVLPLIALIHSFIDGPSYLQ
jgi:hypothetical protein